MSVAFECPILSCDWKLERDYALDARNAVAAPGVAAAMGVPLVAFQAIREQQMAKHTEAELDRHFRSHPVLDWVRDLMAERQRLDAVRAIVRVMREVESSDPQLADLEQVLS